MISSSVKSFENELKQLESVHNSVIPKDTYYVVKCSFDECLNAGVIDKLGKFLLSFEDNIAVYSSSRVFLLIRYLNEDDSNELSHSSVISKFCGLITKETGFIPELIIVYFNSQTQLMLYVFFQIHSSSQIKMSNLCKSIVTTRDLHFKTESELKCIMSKNNINWDDIPKNDKYGSIIKLKSSDKDNKNYFHMSEMPDAREINKYIKFVFSS